MIDIHLVSWNRPKMTKLVIETIFRNTTPGTFRLNIFDNGSDEETIQLLNFYMKRHQIILYPSLINKGLEYARQFLFKTATKGKYFVDMDNDCLPQPPFKGKDWLEHLIELMNNNEEYAAIACRTQVMIGTGNIFEQSDKNDKDITEFPHPGGSIRIMRKSAIKEVNGWNRGLPGRGSEERYICGKLREAGYNTGFANKVQTLHLFGTRGNNPTDRWGYPVDWQPEQTGHSDIWHPKLHNGDDFDEVVAYSGNKLAQEYFDANRNH